jgi:TetR/AcrR family transcriptional repressor of mexJK operon
VAEDPKDQPLKGRPKDPEKRDAIIRAARELFLRDGVAAVSMDGIAKAASVAKVTIYSHFADKEALLRAVILAETADYEHPPVDQVATDPQEFRRRLVEFGTALIGVLSRPGVLALGRLLASEATRHPELVAWFYETGPNETKTRLAGFLARSAAVGGVRFDDPTAAADQLLSMWGSNLGRQQLGLTQQPSAGEIEQHVSRCVEVFLRAYATG